MPHNDATKDRAKCNRSISPNSIIIASNPDGTKGWRIEIPPIASHSSRVWVWGLDFWLGSFSPDEARRAIKLLGDANRYPDHGSAMTVIDSGWDFITTGQRVRGVA
jgi:hypothetical protein